MPEEFENGGFTLKTHQIFSVYTTPEKFKNVTITGFVFEKNSVSETKWLSHVTSSFSKTEAPFSKCFPSAFVKDGRFQIPPV